MQILFTGTTATLSKLQAVLKGYAMVMSSGEANIHVCEVRGEQDLRFIPRNSLIPLFLVLDTKEKAVIEKLRVLNISGIFFLPFDAETIKKKMSLVTDYSEPKSESFEMLKIKILAKAESISSLPIFAKKLLTLATDDSTTIREITDQIKMDQGISSKVIRMVNSPFYGLRQDVNSIDRAVVLLGFHTVKNIALVASTNMYYNKSFHLYKTTGAALWAHAYKVALLSEEFARYCGEDSDSLFLAGLLHDIGKTVMVDFLIRPALDCEEERRQLRIDHAEVASMILTRWQFSHDVINLVRHHHEPEDRIASLIVYCANMISHFANDEVLLKDIINNTVDGLPCGSKTDLKEKLYEIVIKTEEDAR